jgi:carbamoyltransferase
VDLLPGGRYPFRQPLEVDDPSSLDFLFDRYFGPFEETSEYQTRVVAAAQEMLNVVTGQ